jgi:hypothetical protein
MLATETAPTLQPPITLGTVPGGRPCAYLAGPMRGYKDFNFPAFHAAAKHLREVVGWDVISPAEIDLAKGFDPTAGVFTLDDWYSAMRTDIAILLEPRVDRIVFLPGWGDSRGANVERTVGEAIGLELWFYIPGAYLGDPIVTMFAA